VHLAGFIIEIYYDPARSYKRQTCVEIDDKTHLQMKYVSRLINKNMVRVRKPAVVQTVSRNMSLNGKYIKL